MKGAEAMRKQMIVFLAIGIICLISGIVMAVLHVAPEIIPTTMIFTGSFFITFFPTWFTMRKYIRGDALIIDEMMKRIDALSGYYTVAATFFFILILFFINYFYPLPLSIAGLLITILLFMSLSFILIRFYFWKRGVTE